MRAIIIDDEPHCIGTLEVLLERNAPDADVVATCRNGEEGIKAIRKHSPDVVFLDIAMPKMNGFEMLAKLETVSFELIFTTAYDEFALRAFRVSAADYLLKPINKDELVAALDKVRITLSARQAHDQSRLNANLFMLLENLRSAGPAFPFIALPTASGIDMVAARDILFAVADGNYSLLHMRDSKPILLSKTLGEMEEVLSGHRFVRVHHSHLVNLAEILRYVKGEGGYVVLKDGQSIAVSRRRKPDLLKALRNEQP